MPDESFDALLSEYERSHARAGGRKQIEGTVVALTADSVLVDIGFKTEGILPRSAFAGETVKPGDKFPVSVTGRDAEGYYQLSRGRVERPTDWASLQQAFADKATIVGTVTAVVKGGASVDVGVRAFMPASRSGTKDAVELQQLVGQQIHCRITKLDVTDEDVVVDRRAVLEDEERASKQHRYSELKPGDTITGTVRGLTDYGAFVDVGGVDALLHVGEISWRRVAKPSDVLSVGQQLEVRVLDVDPEKRRISVGLKQLQAHPWDAVAGKYKVNDRVRGVVTRLVDFGAFVELEPGVEGLIHISEMSLKRINKPSDVVSRGDTVEAVVLSVNSAERRISLGIKQLLPTSLDEYLAEHKSGDTVSGRLVEISAGIARVELGDGIVAACRIKGAVEQDRDQRDATTKESAATGKADLSALTSMLHARWKGGSAARSQAPETPAAGQVRKFRIAHLDPAAKHIELELI